MLGHFFKPLKELRKENKVHDPVEKGMTYCKLRSIQTSIQRIQGKLFLKVNIIVF
jgi:hypothetical protein